MPKRTSSLPRYRLPQSLAGQAYVKVKWQNGRMNYLGKCTAPPDQP